MCTQELATENCDMKGRKVDLDDYFNCCCFFNKFIVF